MIPNRWATGDPDDPMLTEELDELDAHDIQDDLFDRGAYGPPRICDMTVAELCAEVKKGLLFSRTPVEGWTRGELENEVRNLRAERATR